MEELDRAQTERPFQPQIVRANLALTARHPLLPRVLRPLVVPEPVTDNLNTRLERAVHRVDLAAILDKKDPVGRDLVFVRRGQKLTVSPKESPTQGLSDAEWTARMREFLAQRRGESVPGVKEAQAEPSAPAQPPNDTEWYTRMRTYLAERRARLADEKSTENTASAQPDVAATTTVSATKAAKTGNPVKEAAAESRQTVKSYVRTLAKREGSAVSWFSEDRLDTIVERTVDVCERELGPLLSVAARRVLPHLQVQLEAEVAVQTDEEIGEEWGYALTRQIRAVLRRGAVGLGTRSPGEESERRVEQREEAERAGSV